jgi:ABC transporter substrate binding protein
MRRRDFIKVFPGSAITWPLAARAQQAAMPVIGFLHLTSPETNRKNLANFWLGLGDTGYIENKNVTIEYRWAQGRNDQLPALAAELVQRQVSVIVVLESTNGALAAKAATQTIPIVFMQGADPVGIGLRELVLRAIMVVRTHLIFLFGRPWWAIGASRSYAFKSCGKVPTRGLRGDLKRMAQRSPRRTARPDRLARTKMTIPWAKFGLQGWLAAAAKRLHHNVLAAALANKLARIAWSVLYHGRSFARDFEPQSVL